MIVLPSNAMRHDPAPPRAAALPDPRSRAVAAGPADPKSLCHRGGRFGPVLPGLPRALTARADADLPAPPLDRPAPGVECLPAAAAGRKFFSPKTLGWDVLPLPPRPGRSQLPQVLSIAERQRLCPRPQPPRPRALLMPPYAAGRRGSEVVRLRLTDIARDRRLLRVAQGTGRQDRSTRRSTRRLPALRASWTLPRPAPWFLTGLAPQRPLPSGPAQKISSHAKRTAGSPHGHGIHTLRQGCAPPLLEAGGDVRTIQMLRGPQALDTTTRYLPIPRHSLATLRSPCDLLPGGALPRPPPEYPHGAARPRLSPRGRGGPAQCPTVGSRR
jgi:integrase